MLALSHTLRRRMDVSKNWPKQFENICAKMLDAYQLGEMEDLYSYFVLTSDWSKKNSNFLEKSFITRRNDILNLLLP